MTRGLAERRSAGPLDAEVDRFETFSAGLVRLEPHPFDELRTEVERFAALVTDHVEAGRRSVAGRSRLAAEHERFRSSVEELLGLLAVVERDDHGGHRQALGQYGRLLTEALRIHRADERTAVRRGPPSVAPGNGK